MAHKKKIIKCFVCSNEWTPGEDELHASTLKCPHCGMHDFAGNFIMKEKEAESSESRFKPQWTQPPSEKMDGDATGTPTGYGAMAKSSGRGSEHSGSASGTYKTYSGSGSSGGGGETQTYSGGSEKRSSGHSSAGSKGTTKSSPKSVTEEITSGCFIVTATYGTGSYDRIAVFYRFRDEFLQKSMPGRLFTQVYYRISPYPAAAIRRSEALKHASRIFLDRLAPIIGKLI